MGQGDFHDKWRQLDRQRWLRPHCWQANTPSRYGKLVRLSLYPCHGRETRNVDVGIRHIDGDWFYHSLDSSDQALLTVCLYTDVIPDGGPTLICPKALPMVLQWMYEHPKQDWSKDVLNDLMKDIEEVDYVYVSMSLNC